MKKEYIITPSGNVVFVNKKNYKQAVLEAKEEED